MTKKYDNVYRDQKLQKHENMKKLLQANILDLQF